MRFNSLIRLSLLSFAACGSDPNATTSPDAPSVPACEDVGDELLATNAQLLDAIVVDGNPVALVTINGMAAIVQGGVTTPIAVPTTEGSLAQDGSGAIVAILRDRTGQKTYAAQSPAFAPVDTQLDEDLSKPRLVHSSQICTTSTGCLQVDDLLLFFQGGFSSASAAHRGPSGAWSEEELYLSSISWIEDTTQVNGTATACVRFTDSAVLFGVHPYRGDLDDLTSYPATGKGCELTANGADVAMMIGSTPARLAKWTIPTNPTGPWPAPPAAIPLPNLAIGSAGYDLLAEGTDLVLAYADAAGTVHVANEASGWTDLPAPALRAGSRPILRGDATARHLLVQTPERELHYARTCR